MNTAPAVRGSMAAIAFLSVIMRSSLKTIGREMAMQSPADILKDIWTSVGGEMAALQRVQLTGGEPQLPSSFRVGAAAQVSVAAAGLAAAEIWRLRSSEAQ